MSRRDDQPFNDNVPFAFRVAALHIVSVYDIRGLCDAMYVANVIAHELGKGDGCGNFDEAGWPDECSHSWRPGTRPNTQSNAGCTHCQKLQAAAEARWAKTAGTHRETA